MPVNSFTLVNDDKNNIYIAKINKILKKIFPKILNNLETIIIKQI